MEELFRGGESQIISFCQLPDSLKKDLAMYLDCGETGPNWKRLAEVLKCPVHLMVAFEERALYSREGSPTLKFFDQYCGPIRVLNLRDACAEIQNIDCVTILDSYLNSNSDCHVESNFGSTEINILSIEQERLHDFDNSPTPSYGSCGRLNSNEDSFLVKLPLSQGISRNSCGKFEREEVPKFASPIEWQRSFSRQKPKSAINDLSAKNKPDALTSRDKTDSVFITYFHWEKDLHAVLNICNFLKKNGIVISIDTNTPDMKGKSTEEWIKEKFVSVDHVIVIITPKYKMATQIRRAKATCFPFYKPPLKAEDYHITLIYSLMLNEHNIMERRTKSSHRSKKTNRKETQGDANADENNDRKVGSSSSGSSSCSSKKNIRFVCLLPSGSSKKDIPKWLASYPTFLWPYHYRPFLQCLQSNSQNVEV